jgi:hypothetical protein
LFFIKEGSAIIEILPHKPDYYNLENPHLKKLYLVRVRWGDLPARWGPVCAAGALANLDLLVLLDQAKRTEKT